jgi:hypothetical protein
VGVSNWPAAVGGGVVLIWEPPSVPGQAEGGSLDPPKYLPFGAVFGPVARVPT